MSASSPTQANAAVKIGQAVRSVDVFVVFDLFVCVLVVGLTIYSSRTPSFHRDPHRTAFVLGRRIGPVLYAEPRARLTGDLGRGVNLIIGPNGFHYYPAYGIYVEYPPIWVQGVRRGTRRFRASALSLPVGVETEAAAVVMTRSTQYKTRSGLGVGSSLSELRQQLTQLACSITTGMSTPTKCQHGGPTATTVFTLNPMTKRVVQIALVPVDE